MQPLTVTIATAVIVCAGLSGAARSQTADLVAINGKVFTAKDGAEPAQGFAITGNRFIAVGSSPDMRAHVGAATKVIDLAGRFVVPGLADGHFHNEGGGPGVDLSATRSIADLLAAVAAAAATAKPGDVIVSNSDWHEAQLREQRLPLARELDAVAPAHPVVLVRGGHDYILNSAALRRWNIFKDTPVPEGGAITRDATGELTGELVDNAKRLVTLPPPKPVTIEDVLTTQRKVNAFGITSVRVPGSYKGEFFQALDAILAARRARPADAALQRLSAGVRRARSGPHPRDHREIAAAARRGRRMGAHRRHQALGRRRLRRRPHVKALRGRIRQGWHILWPHRGAAAGIQCGGENHQRSRMAGDDARGRRCRIDQVLDAYEAANAEHPIAGKRWAIEHLFVSRPEQLARMKRLDLILAVQDHLYLAAPALKNYLGMARASQITPVKTYLDEGFLVVGGTDLPVVPFNPFFELYHFLTRDTISDGIYGANERVTSREDLLRMITINYAKLTGEADIKGSIESGKLADFAVLSDDFLTVAENKIPAMRAMLTYVGGREVFRDPAMQ